MIINMGRGFITINVLEKNISVQGEMYLPVKENNYKGGFDAYFKLINYWDAPFENIPVTSSEKEIIIRQLKKDCEEKNLPLGIV